jgi:hypothetical protein
MYRKYKHNRPEHTVIISLPEVAVFFKEFLTVVIFIYINIYNYINITSASIVSLCKYLFKLVRGFPYTVTKTKILYCTISAWAGPSRSEWFTVSRTEAHTWGMRYDGTYAALT